MRPGQRLRRLPDPLLRDRAGAELQPITIHFDGSIDRRKVERERTYTMDLFHAYPGDIVVAKIDLKNGAVGIVPDWNNVAVTNHYLEFLQSRPIRKYEIGLSGKTAQVLVFYAQ